MLFSYRMVHSMEAAEDIVHSVFLRVMEREEQFEKIESLPSYLYRSVYNSSLNFIKKRGREELSDSIEEGGWEEEFLLKRIEEEILIELYEAIELLPKRGRKIFKLSYISGYSDKEIAERLKISINTVKSQKQRAKRLLRENLKELFPN